MLTSQIIKNLENELKERDEKIERLEKKNTELQLVFNDYLNDALVKTKTKKWPEGYLKQKKEHAEALVNLRMDRMKASELLKLQAKRYEKELDSLRFQIELLEQNREPGFFEKMLKGEMK